MVLTPPRRGALVFAGLLLAAFCIRAALTAGGYPATADPARINFWGLFGVMMIFAGLGCGIVGCLVRGPKTLAITGLVLNGLPFLFSAGPNLAFAVGMNGALLRFQQ